MTDLLTQLIECNQWHFVGRLGADPEIRYFESGASVCNAPLLVNRPGQKRDDGQKPYKFKLVLWREKAQSFADAVKKGDLIDVQGMVTVEAWTDRTSGEERRGVVLNVDRYEVILKAGQGQQQATPQARPATSAWAGAAPAAAPAPKAAPAAPAWNPGPLTNDDLPY
jgi:single-strand DNA-binding protein